jgi:quercetin dioxygenase-like cupin family protein
MSAMRGRTRAVVVLVGAVLAEVLSVVASPQSPAGSRAPPPQPAIQRTILHTVEVPGSNYQVIEVRVQIAANAHIPKHTHPGTVIGYVLAGDYSIQLDGQPPKSVAPGESFVVPSGVVHEEMAGAHAVTVIAVFTVEKGKALTSPAS